MSPERHSYAGRGGANEPPFEKNASGERKGKSGGPPVKEKADCRIKALYMVCRRESGIDAKLGDQLRNRARARGTRKFAQGPSSAKGKDACKVSVWDSQSGKSSIPRSLLRAIL